MFVTTSDIRYDLCPLQRHFPPAKPDRNSKPPTPPKDDDDAPPAPGVDAEKPKAPDQ